METDLLPVERAVKFVAPDTIEGLAIPFGSPANLDTDGEFFTPSTDLCLEWFGKSGRPFLFEHGLDDELQGAVMGRQTDFETREEGVWATVQLDRNRRYRKAVDRLIEEGALGYSSGAMSHLASKTKTGEITRWPWVELSGTPIPAAPQTLGVHYVKSSSLIEHLTEAGSDMPASLVAVAMKALDDIPSGDDALPDGAKFTDLLDRLTADGVPWVKARRDWHGKSGRVLSAATRERLLAHPATLRQLADDLDELIATADAPKEAKLADFWVLLMEANRTLATAGVPLI